MNKWQHNRHRSLSVLLALALIGSNMAVLGHVSIHTPADSGLFCLCVHPGGSDNAIVAEAGLFLVQPSTLSFSQDYTATRIPAVISHDHQSRAPPIIA